MDCRHCPVPSLLFATAVCADGDKVERWTDRDDDRTKKPDRNAAVTLAPAAADSKFRPMFIHPPINISITILKREHVAGVVYTSCFLSIFLLLEVNPRFRRNLRFAKVRIR